MDAAPGRARGSSGIRPEWMAGRLPAIHVLAVAAFAVLLAGCAASRGERELLRIDGSEGIYGRGHAVSGRMFLGRLYYRMQSVSAGSMVPLNCGNSVSTAPGRELVVELEKCVSTEPPGSDLDAGSMAPLVGRALSGMEAYFPGVSASEARFIAIPFGTYFNESHRHWRDPAELKIEVAFVYGADEARSFRQAIRTFAHEFTHLAIRVRQEPVRGNRSEFMASVAEDCAEVAVFGNLEVDHSGAAEDILGARVRDEALLRSIDASRSAKLAVAAVWAKDGVPGVQAFCRQTLASPESDRVEGAAAGVAASID
ncbi:MAG TPA: hypothetical protein VK000_06220 [Luteimonas sp.]|nr:hypothetical protein [Luteimonas sp.]